MTNERKVGTVPETLQQWREAERAVAVARRGKIAAQTAAVAAEEEAVFGRSGNGGSSEGSIVRRFTR